MSNTPIEGIASVQKDTRCIRTPGSKLSCQLPPERPERRRHKQEMTIRCPRGIVRWFAAIADVWRLGAGNSALPGIFGSLGCSRIEVHGTTAVETRTLYATVLAAVTMPMNCCISEKSDRGT